MWILNFTPTLNILVPGPHEMNQTLKNKIKYLRIQLRHTCVTNKAVQHKVVNVRTLFCNVWFDYKIFEEAANLIRYLANCMLL